MIIIAKNHGNRFCVYLESDPAREHFGNSIAEAIGELVVSRRSEFGIIKIKRIQVEKK